MTTAAHPRANLPPLPGVQPRGPAATAPHGAPAGGHGGGGVIFSDGATPCPVRNWEQAWWGDHRPLISTEEKGGRHGGKRRVSGFRPLRECPNFCVRGLVSLTHHWARDCKRRAIATARPRSPDCSLVRSRCLFLRPDLPSSWRPRPAVSNPPSSAGPEPRAATAWERAWRGPTICHGRARPPCWTQVAMAARSVTAVTKRGPHSCDAVQVEIDDLLKRLRCGTGAQTFR